MNLSKNKIYYYFDSDNNAQAFNNISAIKNHLRQILSIDKKYILDANKECKYYHKDNFKGFNSEPLLIYVYDTISKKESAYKLIIEVKTSKNRIETSLSFLNFENL